MLRGCGVGRCQILVPLVLRCGDALHRTVSMMQPPRFAAGITAGVIVAVFGAMLMLERLPPPRRSGGTKLRRGVRNLTTGATALPVAALLPAPPPAPISRG